MPAVETMPIRRPGFRIDASKPNPDEMHDLVYLYANRKISDTEVLRHYDQILARAARQSALRVFFKALFPSFF